MILLATEGSKEKAFRVALQTEGVSSMVSGVESDERST
jgi:hypothetical protein